MSTIFFSFKVHPTYGLTLFSRVAELEQENARLACLTQGAPAQQEDTQELLSEIDQLRAQLAAAERRERELSSQLSRRPPTVKMEAPDGRLPPTSPVRASSFQSTPKSDSRTSASLSLLVC